MTRADLKNNLGKIAQSGAPVVSRGPVWYLQGTCRLRSRSRVRHPTPALGQPSYHPSLGQGRSARVWRCLAPRILLSHRRHPRTATTLAPPPPSHRRALAPPLVCCPARSDPVVTTCYGCACYGILTRHQEVHGGSRLRRQRDQPHRPVRRWVLLSLPRREQGDLRLLWLHSPWLHVL